MAFLNPHAIFSLSIFLNKHFFISSLLLFSHSAVSDSLRPHGLQHARPPITNSQSLLKLMSIESVMQSNRLILCWPLLVPPSIFPSIRVFSSESVLHMRWPKYWSFSFSISPSSEHSGMISSRMDWLDLLAVQGPSLLWCSTLLEIKALGLKDQKPWKKANHGA